MVGALGIVIGVALWKAQHSTIERAARSPADVVEAPAPPPPRASAQRPRTAAPRLAAPSSGGQIANDQFTQGYDAVKLAHATSSSTATIFYSEIRDPQWATRREAAITPIIERDLKTVGVDTQLAKIECRHSTCELTFTSTDKNELRQANRAMQYALLGSIYAPGSFGTRNGQATFTVTVAFDQEERDHDAWERTYKDRRKQRLALLRREGVPAGYPPLLPE
jgi:hypothetical protein